MESRIPLPTDNIYKFYALFGLLLVIFGLGAFLYVNQSTNNLMYEVIVEHQTLKNIPDQVRTVQEETRFQVLDNKIRIGKQNENFFNSCIAFIIAAGIWMIVFGFKTWHTIIQPLQDEITRLNIKKLKQEVGEEEDT
ncbi:hypothetical protein RN22_12735 [Grimontia sp. AD028]|uniref:hypothetical protein n=1 Tax=Grimontia sp. AD028 TaxID=1581149 RepID=UPI00061A96E1|nr:hypothetical protein [Grimontia sp. AD028]KKD60181.1 hypothetical protein RN22_12735 [Grimontia sp. AD028]